MEKEIISFNFKPMTFLGLFFIFCLYFPLSFGFAISLFYSSPDKFTLFYTVFLILVWIGVIFSNLMLFVDFYLMRKLKDSKFIINYDLALIIVPFRKRFFPSAQNVCIKFEDFIKLENVYLRNSSIGLNELIDLTIFYKNNNISVNKNNFQCIIEFEDFVKRLEIIISNMKQ